MLYAQLTSPCLKTHPDFLLKQSFDCSFAGMSDLPEFFEATSISRIGSECLYDAQRPRIPGHRQVKVRLG